MIGILADAFRIATFQDRAGLKPPAHERPWLPAGHWWLERPETFGREDLF